MTTTSTPIALRIDLALDQLLRRRERLLAAAPCSERSIKLAALYQYEASLWSALFEHARLRVHWRAALTAEAHARQLARGWRRRAIAEARGIPVPPGVGGGVEVGEWADRWPAELAGGDQR